MKTYQLFTFSDSALNNLRNYADVAAGGVDFLKTITYVVVHGERAQLSFSFTVMYADQTVAIAAERIYFQAYTL